MSASAFSLSVVLPGAPSSTVTATGGAPTGAEGLFGGLLAGLVAGGATDGSGEWTLHSRTSADGVGPDALADQAADPAATTLDPALAQLLASLGLTPQPATIPQTPAPEGETPSETAMSGGGMARFKGFPVPAQEASIAAAEIAAGAGVEADAGQTSAAQGAIGSAPPPNRPDLRLAEKMAQGLTPPVSQRPAREAAAPAPVAPPPVQAAAAVAAAVAAPAAEVEAVATAEALPAAPTVRPATAEGETRRAANPSRSDRRETAARSGIAATAAAAPKAEALLLAASEAEAGGEAETGPDITPESDPAEVAAAPEGASTPTSAEVRAPAAPVTAQIAEAPARVATGTVARLAADIVRKVEGQSTRFDLQLDPHGLGKVDVAIEIDRDGKLTAALSFDSAQSASDLRGRAGELRQALEQAGFDIAEGGLTFDLSGQNAGFGGREAGQHQDRAWTGRAFQRAQAGVDDADLLLADTPSLSTSRTRSGVDIRI